MIESNVAEAAAFRRGLSTKVFLWLTAQWKQRTFALFDDFFSWSDVSETSTAIAERFGLLENVNFEWLSLRCLKADIWINLSDMLMERWMDFESVNAWVCSVETLDIMILWSVVNVSLCDKKHSQFRRSKRSPNRLLFKTIQHVCLPLTGFNLLFLSPFSGSLSPVWTRMRSISRT
jgi:hypothetical protein